MSRNKKFSELVLAQTEKLGKNPADICEKAGRALGNWYFVVNGKLAGKQIAWFLFLRRELKIKPEAFVAALEKEYGIAPSGNSSGGSRKSSRRSGAAKRAKVTKKRGKKAATRKGGTRKSTKRTGKTAAKKTSKKSGRAASARSKVTRRKKKSKAS